MLAAELCVFTLRSSTTVKLGIPPCHPPSSSFTPHFDMWSNLAPRRPTAVATCPARVVVPRAETGQDPAPPTKPKKFAKKRKAESFEALAALEGLSSESLADIESLSVDELKK